MGRLFGSSGLRQRATLFASLIGIRHSLFVDASVRHPLANSSVIPTKVGAQESFTSVD
jgi:hypothetical protein